MQVDLGSVFDMAPARGVSREALDRLDDHVAAAHDRIERGRAAGEHGYKSLNLPNTTDPAAIYNAANRFDNPSAVATVGIGGSAFSAATLTDAFESDVGAYYPDNVDPEAVGRLLDSLNLASTVANVVLRSDMTVETLANFPVVREAMADAGVDWIDRMFATTGKKENLRDLADKHDFPSLPVPDGVPGRLSVPSMVGFAATTPHGHDIEMVLKGTAAQEAHLSDSLSDSPAYVYGAVSYVLAERGMQQNATMPYAESFETFSEWSAQLWAESLGKDGLGQTPLRALGATDQHSQFQLYRAGPCDKLVTLVRATERKDVAIPEIDFNGLAYLGGSSLGNPLDVEFEATGVSPAAAGRPSVRIELDRVGEYDLGELFYAMEAVYVLYGEPASVDTFVQPAVEWGKRAVRDLLGDGDFEETDVVEEKLRLVVEQSERAAHGDHGRDLAFATVTEQSAGASEVSSVLYPVPTADESSPQKTDTRPESIIRPHSGGGTTVHDIARTSASLADHLQAHDGIIIVVAPSLLVGATFSSLVGGPARGVVPGDTALIGVIESAGQFVGSGVADVGYLSMCDDWELIRFERPAAHDALWITGGFVAVMGVHLGASVLMSAPGIQSGDSAIAQQDCENLVHFLYLTVVITVLIGPAEELIFCDIAFGRPRRLQGPAPAVVLSSLVLASIRLWSFPGEGLYVSSEMVLVLGSILVVVYERSGNLLVVTLVHGLYNAVQFPVSYAQATGLV